MKYDCSEEFDLNLIYLKLTAPSIYGGDNNNTTLSLHEMQQQLCVARVGAEV